MKRQKKEIFIKIGFKEYSISNYGNIKNEKTGRILKKFVSSAGYYQVNLGQKDGKQYVPMIHNLVAKHFISNPNNFPIINHKDENKLNNYYENLEWCDYLYNANYGTRNTRSSSGLKGNQNAKGKRKSIYKSRYIYIYNNKEYNINNLCKELKCSKSAITEAFRKNFGLVRLGLLTRKEKEK